MIQFGNDKIKEIYVGSDKIKEVYHGSDLVWKMDSGIIQDGYWVHKDTGVKTYFGADADFITNGVMSRPSWIANAKEIQLCTGITEFATETIAVVDPEWGDYSYEATSSFAESYDSDGHPFNTTLEILRFGGASVQEVTLPLVKPYYDENDDEFTSLTEVYLNDLVTTIGNSAFADCTSLTSINLPNSLTSIGNSAFADCESLTSITLPEGLTSIGNRAFYYCTSLSLVTSLPTIPPSLSESVFNATHANLIIKVPAQSVNAYKTATNWNSYANKISAI